MTRSAEVGVLGEKAAVKYLRKNGFLINDCNWRCGRYELDIVAQRWGVLHFVEVKTRKAGGWTTPEEAINKDKLQALRRAITAYLSGHRYKGDFQVDLIAIDIEQDTPLEIRFIENIL